MPDENVNVLQTVIQLRRGTEEQWELVKDSFIPREGEPCTTIYDDGRDALIKIGDGKHTWGELGYIRDYFLVTITESETGELISDKTREEILKAVEQNKNVWAKGIVPRRTKLPGDFFAPLVGLMGEEGDPVFENVTIGVKLVIQNRGIFPIMTKYMVTDDEYDDNFSAQNISIVNLKDSDEKSSAVTKQYTDSSTPTFIYLEEQNDVIQSKTTDLETLKTALMSQTDGYTQTNKPLYKAIKCYAVLDGNCYDLIYSSQETQGAGKKDIVKRTFYAITTDGLNKLSVVIDENQTDENKKVVWTKEAQGIASEQFMVVTFTVTDPTTFALEADTSFATIKRTAEAGGVVYAFVQEPVGPLFGQLTGVSSSGILFSSFFDDQGIMTIRMKSDSNIRGVATSLLARPADIVGGGDFNAQAHRIEYVGEPTYDSDAATKGYVDNIMTAGNNDSVVIKSSTPNSIKKFRITVDDAGAISATEVVS